MNYQLTEIAERARKAWRAKVIATLPNECTDADFDGIVTRACEEAMALRYAQDFTDVEQLHQQLNSANNANGNLLAQLEVAQKAQIGWQERTKQAEAQLKQLRQSVKGYPQTVESLRNQLDGAEADKKRLRELIDEVRQWHFDPESSDYNECDKSPCQWCADAIEAMK
jgi:DNA repair exonuclease SbcCD ATPase subunit